MQGLRQYGCRPPGAYHEVAETSALYRGVPPASPLPIAVAVGHVASVPEATSSPVGDDVPSDLLSDFFGCVESAQTALSAIRFTSIPTAPVCAFLGRTPVVYGVRRVS